MSYLTTKQCSKIKSLIMDINNHLNEISSSFDSLNKKLSSGFRLVDTFSDHFLILVNKKDPDTLNSHHNGLNNILENFFIG